MVFFKLKKVALLKKVFKNIAKGENTQKKILTQQLLKRFLFHILILSLLGLLFIPISKIDGLNPLTHSFKDLTFSDIYFSKIRKGLKSDTSFSNIYILNIGSKDKITTRKEIAKFLEKVDNKKYKPKVIGIDIMFESYSGDTAVDNQLAINLKSENIVSVNKIEKIDEINQFIVSKSLNKFKTEKFGFSNQWIEKDRPLTERYFKPIFKIDESLTFEHFSLAISKIYDENAYNQFIKKDLGQPFLINYKGNYSVSNCFDINDTSQYFKLKDKIVLIGLYENNQNHQPVYNEDLHYTPTNEKYFGRSKPDKYGIEILANIISNIVNNDFIKYSKPINQILQIVLSLIIYFLLLKFYKTNKLKFSIMKLILQLFIVAFLILLSLFQIYWFNLYIDYTIVTIAAFLSAELVGVVDGLIEKYFLNMKLIQSKTEDK